MAAMERKDWFELPAHEFLKTEALVGRASVRKIDMLVASMASKGWIGDPIFVVEINFEKYVIDGHHRVFAARILKLPVRYSVISNEILISYAYSSTDSVVNAHAEAGPNRIRLRR
jgi:ParB-like chromosome segregation protein Spo0J